MIGIDPSSFANMLFLSVVLGGVLAVFFELLRFVFDFFTSDQALKNTKVCSGVGTIIYFAVRDIIFFVVSGVVFSVFVYYSNDGNVRFLAVVGVLLGFYICYLSLGRLFRTVFRYTRKCLHKILLVLTRPFSKLLFLWINFIKRIILQIHTKHKFKKSKSSSSSIDNCCGGC